MKLLVYAFLFLFSFPILAMPVPQNRLYKATDGTLKLIIYREGPEKMVIQELYNIDCISIQQINFYYEAGTNLRLINSIQISQLQADNIIQDNQASVAESIPSIIPVANQDQLREAMAREVQTVVRLELARVLEQRRTEPRPAQILIPGRDLERFGNSAPVIPTQNLTEEKVGERARTSRSARVTPTLGPLDFLDFGMDPFTNDRLYDPEL